MIEIIDKEDCCGCEACVYSCPQDCISLNCDKEGFEYPKVDINRCVQCRICNSVCPIENVTLNADIVDACYIAFHTNNDIRNQSSSGGVFSAMASYILDLKGICYGAAFDSDWNVCHIRIDTIDELELLRGSKYVQSKIGDVYLRVKEDLLNGHIVLYSGTSCQITALKNFLKEDYPNLYTVDILCHGVSSPQIWKKYVYWQKQRNHRKYIQQIYFRNKDTGWKNFSVVLKFDKNKEYRRIFTYRCLYENVYGKHKLKAVML